MTFRHSFFAVFAFLFYSSAALAQSISCGDRWSGQWVLSAEGRPVGLYRFTPSKDREVLAGEVARYDAGSMTLSEATLFGKPVRTALTDLRCEGSDLLFTQPSRRASSGTFLRASGAPAEASWLTLAGLPEPLTSPKFSFRRVADNIDLPVINSKVEGLALDIWGTENRVSNQELAALFREDQAVRSEIEARGGWDAVRSDAVFMEKWRNGDAKRLDRVAALLRDGVLRAGIDFYRAAFIFQHGSTADHYLRAHHLALVALALKFSEAGWIAAATIDRFLQATGRAQIYGTQSSSDRGRGAFDPKLVSDNERRLLSVPAVARR